MKAKAVKGKKSAVPSEPIESWEEVERVIEMIARRDVEVALKEAVLNEELAAVQGRYAPEIVVMKESRDQEEARVLTFAKKNKRDFGEKKSRKFNHGTIVFSKAGESVQFLVDEAEIIANLKKRKLAEGVVKSKESIDKDALKTKVAVELRKSLGFEVKKTGGEPSLKIDHKSIETPLKTKRKA